MSHLGERLSALIDGELADTERDRVLAHLAGCDACRQDAIALRALKQRMHSLGEAIVDAALTGRLMAVGRPGEQSPWPARARWRPRTGYSATRLLTAGILASAVAGLGATAFVIGGPQQTPGPKVTPALDSFLVQHASVTGDLPVTPSTGGPASGQPAGTSSPSTSSPGTSSASTGSAGAGSATIRSASTGPAVTPAVGSPTAAATAAGRTALARPAARPGAEVTPSAASRRLTTPRP
jgi:Putative zinc-finger